MVKALELQVRPQVDHSRFFCQCLLWVKAAVDAATCLLVQNLIVATMVTYSQKGLKAVLRHEAPDIYRLDQAPGISREDLYQNHIPELRQMAEARSVEGLITLQDLVEMNEWVAEQVGVAPEEASKTETALHFVR